MKWSLVRRRPIFWPTWRGWLVLALLVLLPAAWWFFNGEKFLSETKRVDAEVLIVEAWIGIDANEAAAAEFLTGGYDYLVVVGGLTESKWDTVPWSELDAARDVLAGAGVPENRIITAEVDPHTEAHRTYSHAVATRRALGAIAMTPGAANVFTIGTHSRRSRLVFAKTLGRETRTGSIGWVPPGEGGSGWWDSSDRAKNLIIETIGFFYELLFNSGRDSEAVAPVPVTSEETSQSAAATGSRESSGDRIIQRPTVAIGAGGTSDERPRLDSDFPFFQS